jgi:hypothetical protein
LRNLVVEPFMLKCLFGLRARYCDKCSRGKTYCNPIYICDLFVFSTYILTRYRFFRVCANRYTIFFRPISPVKMAVNSAELSFGKWLYLTARWLLPAVRRERLIISVGPRPPLRYNQWRWEGRLFKKHCLFLVGR